MDDAHAHTMTEAILLLAHEIRESRHQRERELDIQIGQLATKHDLKELEKNIMSKLKDLGPTLGNVLDMLGLILTEVTDLEANLTNVDLPSDAETNLAKLTSLVPAIQKVLAPAAGTTDIVTIDAIANQTAAVGAGASTVALTGIGSSVKGATLTATVVSSDTTIVPSPTVALDAAPATTGTVTFTPGVAGVATLTVTVSDGTAQAVKLFTVTVA